MLLGPMLLPAPWEWQATELRKHGRVPKRAVFASPRLGKTQVGARWMRDLMLDYGVERGLVSAPLRVCPIWVEVLTAAGIPVISCYDISADHVRRMLKSGWEGVVVINTDKLAPLRTILAGLVQAFILDESHQAKSPSSKRGRAARLIAKHAAWVRSLTGTPVPNHYGDLWSQANLVGAYDRSWGSWMDRYTVRDRMFPSKVTGHINEEELLALVNAFAATVRREDVFGPDQYQTVIRDVHLPDSVMALYRKLAKEWLIDEPKISVPNVLARMLRLQQITSGFLPDFENEGVDHVLHTCKHDALLADLDEIIECGEKSVIFHRYRAEGKAMVEATIGRKIPTYVVNGDYDANESAAQMKAFKNVNAGAVIIVQQQSGGAGVDLRAARHAQYLSRNFSFVDDEQSRDRIYEEYQPRVITYYEVPGTIDKYISSILAKKRDIHAVVRTADLRAIAFGEQA